MSVRSPSKSSKSVSAVYDWACRFTAESRHLLWTIVEYYWSAEVEELRDRLLRSQRQLIAVLGCQGVGKTSAMQALEFRFNFDFYKRVISKNKTKEEEDASRGLKRRAVCLNCSDLESFLNLRIPTSSFQFLDFNQSYVEELNKMLRFKRLMVPCTQQVSNEDAEIILGKEKCRRARMASLLRTAPQYEHLLIDLPDYSKTDRRLIGGDLDKIQALWRHIISDQGAKTNLVVFMQEETFHGHFFFGKMDVVKIKPFTAQQLLSAYKKKFNDTYPFTEEALLHLARLSRGVFRRFLQYIKLCLDKRRESDPEMVRLDKDLAEEGLLDRDFVEKAIPKERLSQDIDAELAPLFPKNPEARSTAVEILNLLEERKAMNQKTIAEELDIPEYRLSRIIKRLDAGGRIVREKTGLDKIVKLAERT